jgi:Leucine-rich repeat (LRR) protein
LSHGKLVGSIPPELFLLTSLAYFNLESNELSGTLSIDVGKLQALQTLVLSNNRFEGTIPYDSMVSTSVEYFGLTNNTFSGPAIGEAIRDMTSLKYLYLDRNKLQGELPVALGGAANLRSINLDFNGISGRVPAIIGRLKNLEYLSIQSAKLQGSIPGEINLLTKLKTLNLMANQLSGELPDLSPMTSLTGLLLVGNRFRGRIEDVFTNLRALGESSNVVTKL